jgi:hypothetical protein
MAWTENKDSSGKVTSYSQRVPGGTSDNPLTLKATLDGSQEIVDSTGKVIATRTADQKDFQAKDNSWNQIDQNTKNSISSTATTNTYKLVQDRGTSEQKESIKQKEQYKSSANTLDEQIESDQGYRATDDASSGVASFFPVGKTFNGRLQYPLQMSDQQDKIKFTAVEIEKGQFTAPSDAGSVSSFSSPNVTYKKVDSSIYMAIQGPISDTNTAQWGEGKLSAIDAYVFNASRTMMSKEGQGSSDLIGDLFKNLDAGQQELKDYLAGQAASIPDILSRTKTKVLNPNLELLFQGPQLRPFQFSFKMSARDEDEALAIKYIIKYFKRHMAVRKDNTALFLKAPHVFTIQYLKGNELHPSMNLISPEPSGETKAAALIACSVNYTPLGNYATYNDSDGTMVSYELTMQFQEIEPLYDTDYTEGFGKDHLIGY